MVLEPTSHACIEACRGGDQTMMAFAMGTVSSVTVTVVNLKATSITLNDELKV